MENLLSLSIEVIILIFSFLTLSNVILKLSLVSTTPM
ncbi:hypothetical protein H9660_15480 [Clostridium sp. Sa3CUN1]|uniref:Uncharacterized protein n=1 Tax=Clostridium gallinarum TaxID=2762246 RepID=A0ABR8Q7X4_9CLOT|nr:hypothetical protein [Clostridium gallinarum]